MANISIAHDLAQLLCRRVREGVPEDVMNKARHHIADMVGIGLAGRFRSSMAPQVMEMVSFGGARGDCLVLGTKQRLPPANAAFANSAFAHLDDFDDVHGLARVHPSTMTWPAACAAGELVGASYEEVVVGSVIGMELVCRLGAMWSPKGEGPGGDWFLTQLFGYFGAAVAASIVFRCNEAQVVSALGLAYMQAAGGRESGNAAGATARSIYPGFAAAGGLNAAIGAKTGIAGPASVFDGKANLFRLYMGENPNAEAVGFLLNQDDWSFRNAEVRRWPNVWLSLSYIAAALAVRAQIGDRQIRRVKIAVNKSAARLCYPLEVRKRPRILQEAKFNIVFGVAFALVHGGPTLQSFNEASISDERVLAITDKTCVTESLADCEGMPPAEIEVEVEGETIRSPTGLKWELTSVEIRGKFLECLAFAGVEKDAGQLWDLLIEKSAVKHIDVLRHIPSR